MTLCRRTHPHILQIATYCRGYQEKPRKISPSTQRESCLFLPDSKGSLCSPQPPPSPAFTLGLFSGYDRMMVLSAHRRSCLKKLFHLISLTCQGFNSSQRRRAPLASNERWCNQVVWCDIGVSASGCLLRPCVQKERKNARRGGCFHFSTACNYPCICLWCHGATLPTRACASDLVLGEEMKAWRDSLLCSSFKA